MRIKELLIEGLFGLYDYKIPFKLNERITIVIGPNGYGKTRILLLILAILRLDFQKAADIPFKRFTIKFDDNSSLEIIKSKNNKYLQIEELIILNSEGKKLKFKPGKKNILTEKEIALSDKISEEINRANRDLHRISLNTWQNLKTGELIESDSEVNKILKKTDETYTDYQYLFKSTYFNFNKIPAQFLEYFNRVRNEITPSLVGTRRLYNTEYLQNMSLEYAPVNILNMMIKNYSWGIVNKIEDEKTKTKNISKDLDSTFNNRLRKYDGKVLTKDELKKELEFIQEEEKKLKASGFIDKEKSSVFKLDNLDEESRKLLTLHIRDMKIIIMNLEILKKRMALFLDIINEKFINKQLLISPETGFKIILQNGDLLELDSLSSGEQHQIIIWYEVLFNAKPGTLFLIDEPEISLHITWQADFIKDLKRILSLVDLDFFIVTHSPDIIDRFWNLTIELEGN
ncbi:AAA family ATPase [Candidatus Dependentiae bacterium]|nr:AAA family ATPase [Candidatus Dependentiae bacterium]